MQLTNIDIFLGTRFLKRTPVSFGQSLTLHFVHLSTDVCSFTRADLTNQLQSQDENAPCVQITLWSYDDAGRMRHSAVIQDFVVDDLNHFERVAGRDRVDQYVAMNPNRMSLIQGRIFVLWWIFESGQVEERQRRMNLSSCIYDLAFILDAVAFHTFWVGSFEGRKVRFYELVLYELLNERWFS